MSENQVNTVVQEQKTIDKELNFRALETKFKRDLEQERQARLEAEKRIQEIQSKQNQQEDDEDEPYVAPRKLEKKLAQFGQNTQTDIQKAMEIAKQQAKEEMKQEMWLEKNNDFYNVMQHAQKLYETDKEMADSILTMPDTFERQKIVYKAIKNMGLHEEKKQPSIQDKIEANKKSPYYQPSGIATAPYAGGGDFSPVGQKNAYDKMQELKNRLRM
jgi:hypothetical protein